MEAAITKKIESWLTENYDLNTRNEIKKLQEENNESELYDRFYKNLEFGTGGLRGKMGAGSNRINIYTIGMATQGLANYINASESNSDQKSVIIAYDSRNNSKTFSLFAARVLAANNIKTYLFNSLRPTPLLSFAVRNLKTISGIVITASHSPPAYNGYKVY